MKSKPILERAFQTRRELLEGQIRVALSNAEMCVVEGRTGYEQSYIVDAQKHFDRLQQLDGLITWWKQNG